MALTKVTRSGITDDSINAAKIEDGTIVDADITPGTITTAKLASTLDLSSKTVTLPNTSVTNAMLAGSIANDKLANSSITINGAATALGGSVSAGSIAWQSKITSDGSTVTTMVAGRGYFVDNSSAAGIVKLPAAGTAGDTIQIKDYAGNFGTNSLVIQRNGHNIQGVANDSEIDTNKASVVLVYIDATKGWLYTNESNVAVLQQPQYVTATGGTVATSGDFKIHSFTGDSTFVVSNGGNPVGSATVQALIVAGGGGGGQGNVSNAAGGGGGGGIICYPALSVPAATYPITVGGGGAGTGPAQAVHEAGINSTTAFGISGSPSIFQGQTAATGAPGGQKSDAPGPSVRVRNGHASGAPQSNAAGTTAVDRGGNGGGGAGGTGGSNGGSPGTGPQPGGAGGNGLANSITGSSVTRAGGGGGGGWDNSSPYAATGGAAGPGGGGAGGNSGGYGGTAGSANTGGGGGGGSGGTSDHLCASSPGAAGGKGIVIIKYKFQN